MNNKSIFEVLEPDQQSEIFDLAGDVNNSKLFSSKRTSRVRSIGNPPERHSMFNILSEKGQEIHEIYKQEPQKKRRIKRKPIDYEKKFKGEKVKDVKILKKEKGSKAYEIRDILTKNPSKNQTRELFSENVLIASSELVELVDNFVVTNASRKKERFKENTVSISSESISWNPEFFRGKETMELGKWAKGYVDLQRTYPISSFIRSAYNCINEVPIERLYAFIVSFYALTKIPLTPCLAFFVVFHCFFRLYGILEFAKVEEITELRMWGETTGKGWHYFYDSFFKYDELPTSSTYSQVNKPKAEIKKLITEIFKHAVNIEPETKIEARELALSREAEKIKEVLLKLEQKGNRLAVSMPNISERGIFEVENYEKNRLIEEMEVEQMEEGSLSQSKEKWKEENKSTAEELMLEIDKNKKIFEQAISQRNDELESISTLINEQGVSVNLPHEDFVAMETYITDIYNSIEQWTYFLDYNKIAELPPHIYSAIANVNIRLYTERLYLLNYLQTIKHNLIVFYNGFSHISVEKFRDEFYYEVCCVFTLAGHLFQGASYQVQQFMEMGNSYMKTGEIGNNVSKAVVEITEKCEKENNKSIQKLSNFLIKSKNELVGSIGNFEQQMNAAWKEFQEFREQQHEYTIELLERTDYREYFKNLAGNLSRAFAAVWHNQTIIMNGIGTTWESIQELHSKVNVIFDQNQTNQAWSIELARLFSLYANKNAMEIGNMMIQAEENSLEKIKNIGKSMEEVESKIRERAQNIGNIEIQNYRLNEDDLKQKIEIPQIRVDIDYEPSIRLDANRLNLNYGEINNIIEQNRKTLVENLILKNEEVRRQITEIASNPEELRKVQEIKHNINELILLAESFSQTRGYLATQNLKDIPQAINGLVERIDQMQTEFKTTLEKIERSTGEEVVKVRNKSLELGGKMIEMREHLAKQIQEGQEVGQVLWDSIEILTELFIQVHTSELVFNLDLYNEVLESQQLDPELSRHILKQLMRQYNLKLENIKRLKNIFPEKTRGKVVDLLEKNIQEYRLDFDEQEIDRWIRGNKIIRL